MLRLAFTFVLLLLMLFGGAVWLLGLEPQLPSTEREAQKQEEPATKVETANRQPADDIDALRKALERNPTPSDGSASFDIARIDPEGTSVFAGRGEPNSLVTITVDGKEIGTAQVDENGEWTFTTEGRISNPDGKLALFKAPPGSVPRDFAAAEPKAPKTKPSASASAEPQQKTARAVTSNMLKSLEGMVAEARKAEDKSEGRATVPEPTVAPPAPAAASPSSSAGAAPASESTPLPESAAPQKSAAASAAPLPEASPRASVPVPVTFVYNEATLTGEGRRAAQLLLEYLQIKRFPRITLTGHADERGSDELNMNLSRDRLETVARFLREGGYSGQLDLVPKGKSEPYTGVVRGDFSQEDLWQLDRRVELLVSR